MKNESTALTQIPLFFLAENCCICHQEKDEHTPRTKKCKNFHIWEPKFPECTVRWPVTSFSPTRTSAFSKAEAGRGIIYNLPVVPTQRFCLLPELLSLFSFRRSHAITDLTRAQPTLPQALASWVQPDLASLSLHVWSPIWRNIWRNKFSISQIAILLPSTVRTFTL